MIRKLFKKIQLNIMFLPFILLFLRIWIRFKAEFESDSYYHRYHTCVHRALLFHMSKHCRTPTFQFYYVILMLRHVLDAPAWHCLHRYRIHLSPNGICLRLPVSKTGKKFYHPVHQNVMLYCRRLTARSKPRYLHPKWQPCETNYL